MRKNLSIVLKMLRVQFAQLRNSEDKLVNEPSS